MAEISTASGSGITVLLVEDERSIRVMLHKGLEQLGYRVISAYDEADAAQALSYHKDPLHVAVVDIRLPGGASGLLVAPVLRKAFPGLKFIFTSGKLLDPEEVAALRGAAFLSKPFGAAELARAIERVLTEDPSGSQLSVRQEERRP